jgi:hypothetical protein
MTTSPGHRNQQTGQSFNQQNARDNRCHQTDHAERKNFFRQWQENPTFKKFCGSDASHFSNFNRELESYCNELDWRTVFSNPFDLNKLTCN